MNAFWGLRPLSVVIFAVANFAAFSFWWVQLEQDLLKQLTTNFLLIWPLVAVIGEIGYAIYRQRQPKSLTPIRLSDTRPTYAIEVVNDYLDCFEETEFGFPTGFFVSAVATDTNVRVYQEQTLPTRGIQLAVLVCVDSVREAVERLMRFNDRSAERGNYGDEPGAAHAVYSWGIVLAGFFASCALTTLFFFPVWIAILGEAILKKFLAASITVRVAEAPDQRNDSLVTIELRGMSALKAEKVILRAFDAPMRPSLGGVWDAPSLAGV